MSRSTQQQLEQRCLTFAQRDLARPAPHLARRDVEDEVVEREHGCGLAPAAQQRADPRVQLIGLERLHDVVVGAGVESVDAVCQRIARRQHEDRGREAARAHPATDLGAAHARKAEIEYEQIRYGALDRRERTAAVRRELDAVSLRCERALEHAPDRRVVVDDEDRLAHRPRTIVRIRVLSDAATTTVAVIEARSLTKVYGDKRAVDELSFTVKPGIVTGFLGPNGSGKATAMRLILGLDRPTVGDVTVNGRHYRD